MDRTRHRSLVLMVAVVAIVGVSACGDGSGGGDQAATSRPATTARLQIVQPTANQVTGPDTELELNLIGAKVVRVTTGALRPDEGHIHVSVDGKLVSMTFGLSQDLRALAPGPHSVQAEFVAKDHAPFRNRVVAAVLFKVSG